MSFLGSIYSLPPSFFDVSAPTQESESEYRLSQLDLGPSKAHQQVARAPGHQQGGEASGQTCQACGIGLAEPGFASTAEQREHFKTDWHRYNVRRRVAKQLPVSESQFEQMLENGSEVSSISGSSSEDEDEYDNEGGKSTTRGHQQFSVPPQVVFTAKDGRRFCVWKALIEKDASRRGAEPMPFPQLLAELQQLRASQGIFVVILLRGGHFAASVFKARAPGVGQNCQGGQGGKGGANDAFEVLDHKTCHRYVIRAKAGGRQSTKDNSGKNIKSAGAALRRYNEAALDDDVSRVMASWSHYLQAADRIFVQTGSADAKSIFSADSVPQQAGSSGHFQGLSSSDPRVRRIPFATQRPTFSESRRVVGLLTSVFEPSAGFLAAEQAAADAAAAASEQREKRQKERQQQKKEAQQQQQASQKEKEDGSDDECGDLASKEALQASQTPLHRAARAGDAGRVAALLSGGADVTARDSRGRTPYLVASTKDVRDAFRRFMAAEPDRWDYSAAGVPSALTEDLEAAQAAKKADKKARQKAKEQERKAAANEKKKKAEEDAKAAMDDEIARAVAEATKTTAKMKQPASSQAGGKVGGGKKGAAGAAAAASQPLSPEELARRREVQAAAAEARMRALQAASNSQRLY
ncbi:hypothetical protein DUNSADRAFT_12639 [Dunaliella salina]|uniref:VLRF1 domain-containing protein n=1 Tax=Dunaliella salina TaxID=3046 RepID=A0ABQ7H3N2_DUNSA|nr:hypothetical protein DUNSADRAFT_12639 [Dunaliella salina]|eukprot:KAF5841474.1 hypothetical protein DUNSADRAFT_12639 [Dunaliella salina]